MRKAYIFIYTDSLGTRDKIADYLSEIPEVVTWRYDMPNCFYIISNYDADEITDAISEEFDEGRFLITEITSNSQGWLLPDTWDFINKKGKHRKS